MIMNGEKMVVCWMFSPCSEQMKGHCSKIMEVDSVGGCGGGKRLVITVTVTVVGMNVTERIVWKSDWRVALLCK